MRTIPGRYLWYDELGTEVRDRVHIFSSFFHQRLMDSTRDMTGSKELRYSTAHTSYSYSTSSLISAPPLHSGPTGKGASGHLHPQTSNPPPRTL